MARIVGGSPLGFLSGKLGGYVFAHNKAGQYIRQYVIPVNPNTVAQLAARAYFGIAVSGWHSLSMVSKAQWGSYAAGIFSPKIGVNMGQFSGFNAYSSLRTVCVNAPGKPFVGTMEKNGAVLTVPATYDPYVFSFIPPTFQLNGNIKEQVSGNALALTLKSVVAEYNGKFKVEINIAGAPTGGSDIEDFIDSTGNEFGVLVQMSNGNPQPGMFYTNPYMYTLGYMGHPNWDAGDRSGVEYFGIDKTNSISTGSYQSYPNIDDIVLISVYLASKTGMLFCIGSKEVSVT